MTQRYFCQIYWHFTGGPRIPDDVRVTRPSEAASDDRPLKIPSEAFEIACNILESRTLKATSREIWGEVASQKFACVTDIPLKDLTSHAEYYGQTAIGFHHEAIHREWSPILYVPTREAEFLEALVHAISIVIESDAGQRLEPSVHFRSGEQQIKATILRLIRRDNPEFTDKEIAEQYELRMQLSAQCLEIAEAARQQVIQRFTGNVHRKLLNLLKVTEFGVGPGESFYQEREWRHIGDFSFAPQDVTALVVPSQFVSSAKKRLEELDLMEVSVIGWDVIEHG